jgi:Zn-dependent peptidase ImmA (M78 family)
MPGKDTNIGAKRARDARSELGLDAAAPLDCLLTTVEERAGLPVVVARLAPDVAGCCFRDGPRALLWVNGEQAVVRQRFTLAHELGHVRCRHGGTLVDSPAMLAGDTHDPREVQANAFAAEFLAPRAGVVEVVELVDGEPGLSTVVATAERFGISAIAALYRLATLGLTTRLERLRGEIEQGLHEHLRQAPDHADALAAILELPRLPAGSALAALLRGDVSLDAAAGASGCEPGVLEDALWTLGG